MEAGWNLLIDLMAILAGAFLLGAAMEKARLPAVIGYIFAGVLLGPGAAGVVQSVDAVRDLAEIGVALLLFSIGLEFSLSHVLLLGRVGLVGGSLQVLLTLGVTFAIAATFGMDSASALALGSVVALSSTVIVLKALKDRGDLDAIHGKAATAVLIFQDLAFVPLVVLISVLGNRPLTVSPGSDAGPAFAQIVIGLILVIVIAVTFVPRVLRSRTLARNRELPILLAITLCMGASWFAHFIGLSAAIGAFVAGILLAESPFAVQVRADVGPLKTLFATLFFASIGMLADPHWIGANWGFALSLGVGVVLGKSVLAFGAFRLVRVPTIASLAAGFSLAQIGELSFVLLQLAATQGTLEAHWVQAVTSASVITLLAAPLLVAAAPTWSRRLALRIVHPRKLAMEEAQARRRTNALEGHVVLIGLGEAGRSALEALRDHGFDVLVLETDRRLVEMVESQGVRALLGDATQEDVLESARLTRARGVVLAVSDHRTATLAAAQVKRLAPRVPIVARARYHLFLDEIRKSGADLAIDEETLVGRNLAEELALQLGGLWDSEGRE